MTRRCTLRAVDRPPRTCAADGGRLGMAGIDRGIGRTDWTDGENDLLVADYFVMLREEILGRLWNGPSGEI